jgi:hypothetical protein
VYYELNEDDPPGRLGSAISRSSSQALHLSLLCSLLEGQQAVYAVHIEAAKALWDYCRASAYVIFGNIMDPLAETVLVALVLVSSSMEQSCMPFLDGTSRPRSSAQLSTL